MYSKPLATRMDGVREAPTRVKRGQPLTGAVNFSSFLPQGGAQAPALPGAATGKTTAKGATPLEQAATQNNLGLNQMQALAALTTPPVESSGNTGKEAARPQGPNMGLPLNPRDLFKLLTRSNPDLESAETAVRVKSHRKAKTHKERTEAALSKKLAGTLEDLRQNTGGNVDMTIGKLAAQFESGGKGIAAIGYDRHGGTSYGKYQLSSRAGTMKNFIAFCKTEAPDIAEQLEKSGGSLNTGGRRGKMPAAWTRIAEEQPDRFEALQDKFIQASHFEPAMRAIAEKSGLNREDMPFALQEVVFSTAVQHGPAAATRIIARAMGQVGEERLNPEAGDPAALTKAQENLIRKIYDDRSGQFRSSTQQVQAAVKNRLRQEMSIAITMLRQEHVA